MEKTPLFGIQQGRLSLGRGQPLGAKLMIVFMPWLVFTSILCMFVFVYHKLAPVVWVFVALSMIIGTLLVLHGNGRKMNASMEARNPRSKAFMIQGVLVVIAVFMSAALGAFVYDSSAKQFWAIEERRTFTNVRPDENSQSHADAGTLIFAEEARVDVDSSAGFDNGHGVKHCVAPIVTTGLNISEAPKDEHLIEYWAVGEDCCEERGEFSCYDAHKEDAHSGVILIGDKETYIKATKQAAGTFELKVAKKPLFVKWVKDPEAFKEQLQERMVTFVGIAVLGHLVLSFFPLVLV